MSFRLATLIEINYNNDIMSLHVMIDLQCPNNAGGIFIIIIIYLFAAITYSTKKIIQFTRENSEAADRQRLQISTNMTPRIHTTGRYRYRLTIHCYATHCSLQLGLRSVSLLFEVIRNSCSNIKRI